MPPDPYREFALVYDEWQSLFPRPFSLALTSRLRGAVSRWGIPARIYADLACGTGLLANWWQRRYPAWTVCGVDRSPAMIAVARRSARAGHRRLGRGRTAARSDERRRATSSNRRIASSRDLPAKPSYLAQDLTRLALPVQAGLASCLFDSLNHVTRTRDLRRILRNVKDALLPGGLFVFDLVDESDFAEVFTGASIESGKDLYVGVDSTCYQRSGTTLGRAIFTFFHRSGSAWRRLSAVIVERCWTTGEIESLLEDAGLELVRLERIDPEENELVFVARTFWVCRRPRG